MAFILGLYGVQAFCPVLVQPRSSFTTRRSSVITMSAEVSFMPKNMARDRELRET